MKTGPSTPQQSRPPGERRRHALSERSPAWRAGVAGTILAHVLLGVLLWWLPKDYFLPETAGNEDAASRSFEIELSEALAQVTPVPTMEVAPPKFVEVNPAAPENMPDETNLVGAQNQQVAQPVPTPEGVSDTPKVDGKETADSTAIVSGQLTEEAKSAPPMTPVFTPQEPEPFIREAQEERPPAARATAPLPGGEQLLGEADGSAGSTITSLPGPPNATPGPRVEGRQDGSAAGEGYFAGTRRIDRARPQPRPSLATLPVNARQTETILNPNGSKNVGALAYDAKWSAYGEYIQRLIDAVQVQWERLIIRSPIYPTRGTVVRVTFKLTADGKVSQIVKVESPGEKVAEYLCISAITERAPYGEWSEDMIAVLGREQEMTFRFLYQ